MPKSYYKPRTPPTHLAQKDPIKAYAYIRSFYDNVKLDGTYNRSVDSKIEAATRDDFMRYTIKRKETTPLKLRMCLLDLNNGRPTYNPFKETGKDRRQAAPPPPPPTFNQIKYFAVVDGHNYGPYLIRQTAIRAATTGGVFHKKCVCCGNKYITNKELAVSSD